METTTIHCHYCGFDRESVRPALTWPPHGPNVDPNNRICCEIVPPVDTPRTKLMITRPKNTSCHIEERDGDGNAIARLWINNSGERVSQPRLVKLANTLAIAPELLHTLKMARTHVHYAIRMNCPDQAEAIQQLARIDALIAAGDSTTLNFEGPAKPVLP